jgi:ABC-type Zn uptake system ZnuABC Zn-binding protein ZnuA
LVKKGNAVLTILLLCTVLVAACGQGATARATPGGDKIKVLAIESFLADIAQNVAGDILDVGALIPIGVDPHSFQPTPRDVAKVTESDVLIVNGAGFEGFLEELLQNAGGTHQAIEAAAGLTSRSAREGETAVMSGEGSKIHDAGDPHFWLDPHLVVRYVENIRDGLSQADPGHAEAYAANAETYIARLQDLDTWIAAQVKQVPEDRRLVVTNHESLGYFADRYGFRVIGTILPSVSSSAESSAQGLARLVDSIKATGAVAIFLETGSNSQLARQIAQESGVKVVTELYSHSLSKADGPAPTYIDMMRYNAMTIVNAIK